MAIYTLCLIILLCLTMFSIITGNDLITIVITKDYSLLQNLNGTISELEFEQIVADFQFDAILQAIIWISIIASIIVLSSLNILGSGLSDTGSHWLGLGIFFVAIWTILSILSFPLIMSIKTIGFLIYLVLTIIYAIDVIIHIGQS